MLMSKVSRLLGAMDEKDEVVEELEAVVKVYRERLIEEKGVNVQDAVEEAEEGSETIVNTTIEKCPKKKWNVAEEDSNIERMKQLENDTSDS